MTEIRFVQTCDACPEQYDAFLGDEEIGYLRLRHGMFRVTCPFGGKIVYQTHGVLGDGAFATDEEREFQLGLAKQAIEKWLADGRPSE